jgi:hypothetical protein
MGRNHLIKGKEWNGMEWNVYLVVAAQVPSGLPQVSIFMDRIEVAT